MPITGAIGWPVGRPSNKPLTGPVFNPALQNGNGGAAYITPGWIAGLGSPVIAGPQASMDKATNDTVYSTMRTFNVDSDSDKYCMSLTFTSGVGSPSSAMHLGFRRVGQIGTVGSGNMFGVQISSGLCYVRYNMAGSTGLLASNLPTLADGSIITICIDASAGRGYINIDGTWLETGGGSAGGSPAGGLGWVIASPTNDAYIYAGDGNSGSGDLVLNYGDAQYVPAGFTLQTP